MPDPFSLPYVQRAELEVLLLAVAGGLLGSWIVLRGLAFYAHAAGTATFPGLVLADGLGFAAALGAFATAAVFAGGVTVLAGRRRAGHDALTAVVLVGCLAAGVILASDVFHSAAGVETLLFGSLLAIDPGDVWLAGAAAVVALAASATLGRRWLATGFDPAGAPALGLRSPLPDLVLLALIAFATVAALSAVGALLATALLVVPAATARIWATRLWTLQLTSVLLAAAEGTVGLWLSVQTNAPPGATIAVTGGAVFAAAALVRYGVLPRLAPAPVAALALALALAAVPVLAGCGSGTGASGGRLAVVASTTQVADLVRAVGGDRVSVHGILRPNTDPHEYEPRPRDVQAVAGARVVFVSGDGLDNWMSRVVRQSGGHPRKVDLGSRVPTSLPGEADGPDASRHDPHWWHDPANVRAAVAAIALALERADPGHSAEYARNARAYEARLDVLDRGIRACMDGVPVGQRKLVTDHDAFGYFTRRYGITVVGAVIPSQTTAAQPSAGDVAALVRQIRREHVRAVFPESSLSPKLARAIARETGATASLTLYGDTLGPAGSHGDTYLKMEAANADAMVRGFTGGARGCPIGGLR